jgi:hypothetical protein
MRELTLKDYKKMAQDVLQMFNRPAHPLNIRDAFDLACETNNLDKRQGSILWEFIDEHLPEARRVNETEFLLHNRGDSELSLEPDFELQEV